MQSLCTLTTSSYTFCTAVNEKRKHNGGVGGGAGGEMWGRVWKRGEDQRSEVEGSKEGGKMPGRGEEGWKGEE